MKRGNRRYWVWGWKERRDGGRKRGKRARWEAFLLQTLTSEGWALILVSEHRSAFNPEAIRLEVPSITQHLLLLHADL